MSNSLKSVWLLVASTREYSMGEAWVVAAYPDEETAKLHCTLAAGYAKTVSEKEEASFDKQDELRRNCPWDNRWFNADEYGIPTYTVVHVPLCLHPDQYLEEVSNK